MPGLRQTNKLLTLYIAIIQSEIYKSVISDCKADTNYKAAPPWFSRTAHGTSNCLPLAGPQHPPECLLSVSHCVHTNIGAETACKSVSFDNFLKNLGIEGEGWKLVKVGGATVIQFGCDTSGGRLLQASRRAACSCSIFYKHSIHDSSPISQWFDEVRLYWLNMANLEDFYDPSSTHVA